MAGSRCGFTTSGMVGSGACRRLGRCRKPGCSRPSPGGGEPGRDGWIRELAAFFQAMGYGFSSHTGRSWMASGCHGNCGPASIGMILEYLGVASTNAELRSVAHRLQGTSGDDTGFAIEYLQSAVELLGMRGYDLYSGSDLKKVELR